ncbi:MAG: 2OG-Fe(II) oxygenase [Dermatophilus congolensis]|nr:2OG-Fe(II) oxygenase [Dermatophilus congolensis]
MPLSLLDDIASLVSSGPVATGSGALPEMIDGPRVDVDGVGELRPPLSPARVRRLVAVAEPAPYGKGEETLLDASVRDTWQVPSSLVTVDWDGRLDRVLEEARDVLGLPKTVRLRAQFHSLLVYQRGQFFAPHQDSQKHDEMVATLVVSLPAPGTGGELVVHDSSGPSTYRASREAATFVAFYADQRHEVRPVRTGHRITLTYNLLLTGDTTAQRVSAPTAEGLADLLREYFSKPQPRNYRAAETPTRLAVLLDHEYTERTLSMRTLKGSDASAAATLREAAQLADCDMTLALADIHEMRDAWDEDDVGEMIDGSVAITHVLSPEGDMPPEPTTLWMGDNVAADTPTSWLTPYATEHTGYLGNYGNTMDLWYRRAALLVWPKRLAFANRAETTPVASLRMAMVGLADRDPSTVEDLRGLIPSWPGIVAAQARGNNGDEVGTELLFLCAAIGAFVDDADLARSLLAPFDMVHLRPESATELLRVADRHGPDLVFDLLARWSGEEDGFPRSVGASAWLEEVPDLVGALSPRPEIATRVARLAVAHLRRLVDTADDVSRPVDRRKRLDDLVDSVEAVLRGVGMTDDATLRRDFLAMWTPASRLDGLIPVLLQTSAWPEEVRAGAGVAELTQVAREVLTSRLVAPQRAPGDWSLPLPEGCACTLCSRLGAFLADAERRTLEWPLKAELRRHLHARIDALDLPVSHITRREGSPYTLVLAKTDDLHGREQRIRDEATRWLEALG